MGPQTIGIQKFITCWETQIRQSPHTLPLHSLLLHLLEIPTMLYTVTRGGTEYAHNIITVPVWVQRQHVGRKVFTHALLVVFGPLQC